MQNFDCCGGQINVANNHITAFIVAQHKGYIEVLKTLRATEAR